MIDEGGAGSSVEKKTAGTLDRFVCLLACLLARFIPEVKFIVSGASLELLHGESTRLANGAFRQTD